MNGLAGPIDTASPSASDLINRITEEFQVSADAARIRLLKLKVFTDAKYGLSLFG
jgi:Zn-dependent peptidase ImmA (M78 family)